MKVTGVNRQHTPLSAAPRRAEELLSPLAFFIVALALAASVFAVYSPTLNFQFILDDHRFLSDPRLQTPGHLWEYFTSYVWAQIPGGPLSFYRPVFVLWLRMNFILSGMSSWGWHLLSILKHLSVAILLGVLVWKLLRDRVASLLAATLFAFHPAHTESVAWVTVPDPLMSAAVLSTILLYLKYKDCESAERHPDRGKSHKTSRKNIRGKSRRSASAFWILASAGACLAALMAKETAMVLPVILFAVALTFPSGQLSLETAAAGNRARIRERVSSSFRQIVPFLCITMAYLLLRIHALKGQFSPRTQHLPWRTLLLSSPATLWFYGKALLWPLRSRAFADPTLADTFSVAGVLFPGLAVCGIVALMLLGFFWVSRTALRDGSNQEAAAVRRAWLLGSSLLVLPILPALNLNVLNPGDFLHGRYTCLPSAGLMLLLATACHMMRKGRMVFVAAAGAVAIALSVFTLKQESMWKDDLTVFAMAHEIAPQNEPVAHNLASTHVQVALALDQADRCGEAVPIFQQAIQQYPQDWFAWAGLGECFFKLNDLPRAEQSLRRASELSHEPRVTDEWQQVRARMGLTSSATR